MATPVTGVVVDRNKYPGSMMFVGKDGKVYVADRPQPLSEQEKSARARERAKVKDQETKQRSAYRKKMHDAKAKARKEPTVANSEAYQEAKAAYEELMGRA